MNKHFSDAWYYARRAGNHLAAGLAEELEPVEARVREATGREPEPEPTRIERIQRELSELEARAEGEAKQALGEARERFGEYRSRRGEADEAEEATA